MSINCSVRNCVHHSGNGKCHAKSVLIIGSQATSTDETLCKSYLRKSAEDSLHTEFASEFNSTSRTANSLNIECCATKCKHNDSKSCLASQVAINATDASCATFEE
ncbi:MAG: DUF1540 domain-containing protein [Turicibacter sp.]